MTESKHYDIAFIADPRFPGGTSTALAQEMGAASAAGLRCCLLPLRGPALRHPWPFHPAVESRISRGEVTLAGQGERIAARFAIVHHPSLMTRLPTGHLGVTADHAVLVLHHPLRDGTGAVQYDLSAVVANTRSVLGPVPWLAPVGPLVRAQFGPDPKADHGAPLLERDWYNLIDVSDWLDLTGRPDTPRDPPLRIGRHSRPFAPKWPATVELARCAYPDLAGFRVSMLGAPAEALRQKYGEIPAHWDLLPFNGLPVQEYLADLDFYVYFHDTTWVEAFGRAPLEAAACGLTVILPPHFEPVFGPAAVYSTEAEVADVLTELAADPKSRALQARRARAHVSRTFGPESFLPRLDVLDPGWAATRAAIPAAPAGHASATPPAASVLMMTSNGVGLGHLTRLLAIADALPPGVTPVFLTLSRAFGLARAAGYRAEYRPFHRGTGVDLAAWNAALAEDLIAAASFHGADCFVFDGNMPYQGVLDFMATRHAMRSIWVRRGFWASGHAEALTRAAAFDAVIEPGDVAGALDDGPTAGSQEKTLRVPPILRGSSSDLLPRAAACAELGLDPAARHVLFSLGSGTNYDTGTARDLLAALVLRAGTVPVILHSPLATSPANLPRGALLRDRYPVFPLLGAFDFAVATCGYNTFHEHLAAALPTLFVPNEADEMDRQAERARFADAAGFGAMLPMSDLYAAAQVLARFLDPDRRDEMAHRCAAFQTENGSRAAAVFIAQYAWLHR